MRDRQTPRPIVVHASSVRIRAGVETVVAIGLVVLAAVAYLSSGWTNQRAAQANPGPSDSTAVAPTPAEPPPTPAVPQLPICGPDDVAASIRQWRTEGELRIATVALDNIGGRTCAVWALGQPGLYGNGELLIQGPMGSPEELAMSSPGVVLITTVRVENYCGPEPQPAVTVAILQENAFYVATALSPTDRRGVPPCLDKSSSGTIFMEPWAPDS